MLFIAVLIKLRLPSNGIWVAYWSCFILEAARNCAWLQCCVHFYLLVLVPGTCCCAGAGTHMPAFHFWHQLLSHFAYCGGNMTLLGNCAQMCNFWLLGRSKDVSLGARASATSQHVSSSRSKKCTILHRGSIQEKWLVINVRVCARMVIIVVRHDLKIVSLSSSMMHTVTSRV